MPEPGEHLCECIKDYQYTCNLWKSHQKLLVGKCNLPQFLNITSGENP